METEKQRERFVELEFLLEEYFNRNIYPIMSGTKEFLREKRTEEMKEYSTSAAGVLGTMATAGIPVADPYRSLEQTGEWNSKTTEDFLSVCSDRISSSATIAHDLSVLSSAWRDAVIAEVGKERYDAMSESIGADLADAFIRYRMEDKMITRLVEERIPKSSADYIIAKACSSSLFGQVQTLNRTPADDEIESRCEAAYKPSSLEKGSAYTLGAVADAVVLCGPGAWSSLAKFIGIDAGISMFSDGMSNSDKKVSVEQCVSKGIFGADHNLFPDFQKRSRLMDAGKSAYIREVSSHLKSGPHFNVKENGDWFSLSSGAFPWGRRPVENGSGENVPLVIAPEYRKQYSEEMSEEKRVTQKTTKEKDEAASGQLQEEETRNGSPQEMPREERQESPSEENGWGGFLRSAGLQDFGDISQNLGYVLAMLPDILVGLFTGKTKSFNMDNSLLPLAGIVAGMFVRNPLLKILLIGMGGLNLLNRAGHESLEAKQAEGLDNPNIVNPSARHYRQYPDETLDSRIKDPILRGNSLVVTIDNTPCTIQLPRTVLEAYRAGTLPLNTLANAVLSRSDQMRSMVSQNYEQEGEEMSLRPKGIQ